MRASEMESATEATMEVQGFGFSKVNSCPWTGLLHGTAPRSLVASHHSTAVLQIPENVITCSNQVTCEVRS
jgi:hypothetical protein